MNKKSAIFDQMRALAADLNQLDVETYTRFDRDPLTPIVGLGDKNAPIAFFGRDPGKDEVRLAAPFVGAGGKLIRHALQRALGMPESSTTEALLNAGKECFYINTVPYKPIDNKAWPMVVKRQFQPLIASLLVSQWNGREIITLGKEALLWFGINADKAQREALRDFWASKDCFESSIEVDVLGKSYHVSPLPHPSPLNRRWYSQFPALLDYRLEVLDFAHRVAKK
ncbi:hypothetical protein LMG33818_001002 [Halomonadaceae bacterium LMG 33818]|uniref:uracil-DNA glycosylase family protein n=1 Tax=Cernens ardua TaxID=3402176 RepID=UPI003EDBCED1